MKELNINVQKLSKDAKLPNRAYPEDSGADIFANKSVKIEPFEQKIVETDIALDIPEPTFIEHFVKDDVYFKKEQLDIVWEIQIRSKSGLAAKQNLFVMNQPATIDNSYTGELKVILFNANTLSVKIEKGQKIAQIILCPVVIPSFKEIDRNLINDDKNRKNNGFGSTGLK